MANTNTTKWTICDGEHEYDQVGVFSANNKREANRIAKKDYTGHGYEGDYRLNENQSIDEISEKDFEVLRKYV